MEKIRKIVLTVVVFFAINALSYAQTYTLAPNDTVSVNAVMEDLETLTISQTSNTNDTLFLKWKKISVSVSANWDVNVCDNQFCYGSLVDSGIMNPVLPGEYGFLLIHATARVNYGKAVIRYSVWDVKNPSKIDTLTFIINAQVAGLEVPDSGLPFFWFEQNKIHLKNLTEDFEYLLITDLSGKEFFKTNINNQKIIELPTLPTSVYIIQLTGKEKHYQKKIFYQPCD